MKSKNKKIDSVKMMRDIRDKLHQEYDKNPEKRKLDLERVRKKYMKLKSAVKK
jgi:hypothetical protein